MKNIHLECLTVRQSYDPELKDNHLMDVDHISGIKVKPRIGIFLASLGGGGAERAMVNLARELVERGYKVDLLLKQAVGKYFSNIPTNVQIVDLKAGRMIATLPPLIRYINHQHPDVLLSVMIFFSPPASMLGKFDVVVTFGVVEHFIDTRACLDAMSQFLKPGGLLVTSIPNLAGWIG